MEIIAFLRVSIFFSFFDLDCAIWVTYYFIFRFDGLRNNWQLPINGSIIIIKFDNNNLFVKQKKINKK